MFRLHSLLFFSLLSLLTASAGQVTEYILDTVDSGEGQWPCLFYELNYNSDISWAERGKWHALTEDESYWQEGVGPFSIDANKFLVTQWQSTVHPILIRRHFTLRDVDMPFISAGVVTLHYSYDEDPVFWLNGKKLTSATGWNDDNYATLRLTATQKKWLQEGDNVLCVSVRQGAGGGHIDYGLTLQFNDQLTDTPYIYNNVEEPSPAYSLQGQPVPAGTKGITIRQGKKTLTK